MTESRNSSRLLRKAGLERISPLLEELRALGGLRERRTGTFLRGSRPFLHFHYPPDGTVVADVQLSGGAVTRFDVSEEGEQLELLSTIREFLDEAAG